LDQWGLKMAIYLLDTGVISGGMSNNKWHSQVTSFFNTCTRQDNFIISCVAVAEIHYGLEASNLDQSDKKLIIDEVNKYPEVVYIDKHTIEPYYKIRAKLFREYGTFKLGTPQFSQLIKEKQPEQLLDKTSAKSLGIQENDLWMLAQAIEYKTTMVTTDKNSTDSLYKVAKDLYKKDFTYLLIS
jgi:predicted nucleic acid-binding protein